MKEIYLANNKGIVLVDDEDYKMLNQYKWSLSVNKYASASIKNNDKCKTKSMHSLLMNISDGFEIDHIDRNGLNNQKSNLRLVTRSQNMMNVPSHKNALSKFKGVCWDKDRKKWFSQIMLNRKNIHIGRFINEIDAAKAYNKKAKELHGEYAYLNEV